MSAHANRVRRSRLGQGAHPAQGTCLAQGARRAQGHLLTRAAGALLCALAIGIGGAPGATATQARPVIAPSGPAEPASAAETPLVRFGGIEAFALAGAFLYGTSVVFVVRSVARDLRDGVPDEALAL